MPNRWHFEHFANFLKLRGIVIAHSCDDINGNLLPLCFIPLQLTGSLVREFLRRSRQSQIAGFGGQHIIRQIAAPERLLTAKRLVALALVITCTQQYPQQGW